MRVLLSWLRDYVEIDKSAEQVAEILSNVGLPYEGIEHLDGDAVIDVEITSNRGDCLGYIGVARELAAATGRRLKMPVIELPESKKDAKEFCGVEIREPDLCGRYTARIIEGVKVGPSPQWMQKRLEAAGMRSVNNVVDATNYAMLETGQPPHAFDYTKIIGGKIIVRKAEGGEQIVSIDGSKCQLSPDMLVIADTKGPVAVAGVMGGLDTEVSDSTATILLEDAHFDPVSVRTTSRKLALPSEAAFRFGRIVDIENVDWASQRTALLMVQVAGGKVAKGVVDAYPRRPQPKQATLRLSRLNKLLGIDVPPDEAVGILSRLGLGPKRDGDSVMCSVPSWRSDIYREADLIEEVARVYGYDKVRTERKIQIEVTPADARQRLVRSIGAYLNSCGFYESINVSFIEDKAAELFVQPGVKEYLAVADVSHKTTSLLRQSLLPSLLAVIKSNHNAGNTPCRVFEIADTYIPATGGALPVERVKLALACDGELRDIRGVIEGLTGTFGGDVKPVFTPTQAAWAQAAAEVVVNDKAIGIIGMLSQQVKDRYDFKDVTICGAEIDVEQLGHLQAGPVRVKAIPRFPAIKRDLSIIVDENIPWADIAGAVNAKASAELEDLRFVDLYRGKGIPVGKKSITLSLLFRDLDGTLTHEAVDGFEAAIVAELAASVGAVLRTA